MAPLQLRNVVSESDWRMFLEALQTKLIDPRYFPLKVAIILCGSLCFIGVLGAALSPSDTNMKDGFLTMILSATIIGSLLCRLSSRHGTRRNSYNLSVVHEISQRYLVDKYPLQLVVRVTAHPPDMTRGNAPIITVFVKRSFTEYLPPRPLVTETEDLHQLSNPSQPTSTLDQVV